jgi:hypothetical protein
VKILEEYEDHTSEFNDNTFYGDTEALDCPKNIKRSDYCNLLEKYQVMPGTSSIHHKDPHITGASNLPPHKFKKEQAWGSKAVWNRNRFVGFTKRTLSGQKNTIFGSSHYQMDFTPI